LTRERIAIDVDIETTGESVVDIEDRLDEAVDAMATLVEVKETLNDRHDITFVAGVDTDVVTGYNGHIEVYDE
jgi:hypothetical protein